MAGFQLPITQYTPAQLAEMAKAAFRPPALMGGGGGGGGLGQMPQSPGFNLGQGMAGAGQGLGALAGALGKGGDPTSVTPAEGATLWNGPGGGITSVGPGGVYSVTGFGDAGAGLAAGGAPAFGGGRADGGPVTPGKYYTVGEQGPETFVPSVPGRIVPRDFFGGRVRR